METEKSKRCRKEYHRMYWKQYYSKNRDKILDRRLLETYPIMTIRLTKEHYLKHYCQDSI